jgi:hypothetical protein
MLTNLSTLTVEGLPTYTEVRTSTDTPFAASVVCENDVVLATVNGVQYLFGYRGTEDVLDLSSLTFTAVFPYALARNKVVTELKFPAAVREIGTSAFSESLLTKLSFADGAALRAIGERAFEACHSLTALTLPEGLQTIDYRAFASCESLATLTVPASVTEIGESAFTGCVTLATLTFSTGSALWLIGAEAFLGCEALSTVTLPLSLTDIGERAFVGCTALQNVTFGTLSGWRFSPTTEDAFPSLSNTANNAYYLTELYAVLSWTRQ